VVTASFVLWGIGGYLGMMGDDEYAVKVGSKKIYERDIDNAMQQNKQYTDKMQVLYRLVNRQLLLNNSDSYHLSATNEQLQSEIANISVFQESGVFSLDKYKEFLKNSQQTANQFQNNVQDQIVINQVVNAFKDSYFNSKAFNDKLAQLLSKERNVSTYTIDPKKFHSQINLTNKQIEAYYTQNITKFTTPEQVKVQYLTLSPEAIANSTQVSESQIKQYVAIHESELANIQVDVSHILFSLPSNANAKTRKEIKDKASTILAEVKANPKNFASFAKQYSQDPGSATKGGDLGYFGHGVMVTPFEKVAFSLKPNQISDLVETQFGYHILKLNSIKQASNQEINTAAINALKKQLSTSNLGKKLDLLNDLTYNKSDSLEPAAKALGINIQTSNWVRKNTNTKDSFANPKVQKAIFSDDTIKKHSNSPVVDFGDNTYSVYRVIDHKNSIAESLANLRESIIEDLKSQQAMQLANKEMQDDITKLKSGKINLNFTGSNNVNLLSQNIDIEPMVVKQIFSTSISKLPAYSSGVNKLSKIVIYRINKELINQNLVNQNKKLLEQYDANNAMVDLSSYVTSLSTKFSINYKTDRLTPKSATNALSQ
ncbi:MAG: peptidylprolyl isomerase, partial [Burkholderiales bacterium]|nr:peptidylprolyl isomerase [Burkholderiales bacterium]